MSNQINDLARDRPANEKGVTIEVTPEMIAAGAKVLAESGMLQSDRWAADNQQVMGLAATLLATCLGPFRASE
jgi:hypothetical protein